MTKKLFALLAASLLLACGESHERTPVRIGSARSHLFVLKPVLWQDPGNIPVCFEDAGNATERAWVESALKGSWQAADAAIGFTGFGDCTEASTTGIRIKAESGGEGPRTTGFGEEISGQSPGMVLDFTFTNAPQFARCTESEAMRERCVRAIAIHETGHALGFLHEQERPDTPADCELANPAPPDPNTTLVGDWDLMSIMNYCYPDRDNVFPTQLSPTDIKGLLETYPPPAAAAPGAISGAAQLAGERPEPEHAEKEEHDEVFKDGDEKSSRRRSSGPAVYNSGCSSSSAPRPSGLFWLVGLGLLAVLRRRTFRAHP